MSFNLIQDPVLEDEGTVHFQNSDVEHLWKFLSMNRKLGVLSSEGWEKKT
jgi:hypothetical protein